MQFVPVVYEHAASFIDRSPWEVSRSGELLLSAHAEAFGFYHQSPVVMGIDIYNLESEAYGAEIERPSDNRVPSVKESICDSAAAILELRQIDPLRDGRLPTILAAGQEFLQQFNDADIRIPVSGPFSIAGQLMGLEELLMEVIERPERVAEALMMLLEGQMKYCDEIYRRGLGIILFESTAAPPLLSPSVFRRIVLPPLKRLVEKVRQEYNQDVPCIIGGNTAVVLDSLLETGSKYLICPAETDQREFLVRLGSDSDVFVRVNMNPGVFSSNNSTEARKEVDRVLSLIGNRERVCVGSGILPYDADPDLVLETGEYVGRKAYGHRL